MLWYNIIIGKTKIPIILAKLHVCKLQLFWDFFKLNHFWVTEKMCSSFVHGNEIESIHSIFLFKFLRKLGESDDSWNKLWNYAPPSLLSSWGNCDDNNSHHFCMMTFMYNFHQENLRDYFYLSCSVCPRSLRVRAKNQAV